MKVQTTSGRHRGRRIAAWLCGVMLLVGVWGAWRAYDYRAAIREAKALGLGWRSEEPFDRIRQDWRRAFERATWKRRADLSMPSDKSGPPIPNRQLFRLVHRLNPTNLSLSGVNDLTGLEGLSELRWLGIHMAFTLRTLDGLKNMPRLERLTLTNCVEVDDLSGLRGLDSLKFLQIESCSSVRLQTVPRLPELETLVVDFFHFEEWPRMEPQPKLSRLRMQSCDHLRRIGSLGNQPALATLELRLCNDLTDLDGLDALKPLRELVVWDCPKLASVDGLKSVPHLEKLTLSQCPEVGEFSVLRGLTELRELTLRECFAFRDLELIGSKELRKLELTKCPYLTDFSAVKKQTQLEEAKFYTCPHFTEWELRDLSAALPGAKIERGYNDE